MSAQENLSKPQFMSVAKLKKLPTIDADAYHSKKPEAAGRSTVESVMPGKMREMQHQTDNGFYNDYKGLAETMQRDPDSVDPVAIQPHEFTGGKPAVVNGNHRIAMADYFGVKRLRVTHDLDESGFGRSPK